MTTTESMVSTTRLSAIERLGVRLDESFTAEQAMNHANLADWDVRKWPSFATNPETGEQIRKPGRVDIVRTNPFNGGVDIFKEAGEEYHIIQNEEHAELLNTIVDESGAHFELAGSVDGGRKVFLALRLPGHIKVGGVDVVDNNLIAFNSHDGSMAFTLMATPIRYACKNVLSLPRGGVQNMFKVRHTSGARKNLVAQARQALDLHFTAMDAFQIEAERMIQTELTQTRFEEIIFNEFGGGFGDHRGNRDAASEATKTRADNIIAEMAELFGDASTQDGIRNTVWAGFNALTEWADHYAPTRGDDRDNARSEKALLHPRFKAEARELMLALV